MDQPTQQPQFRMSRAFEAAVVVIGGLVAAFFGLLAYLLYVIASPGVESLFVGPTTGGVAGLAAGCVWVRAMHRRFEAGQSSRELAGWGARFGILVGSGATILLHLALQVWLGIWPPPDAVSGALAYGFGLAFGVPAGAITGALCALVGAAVAGRLRRKAAATAVEIRAA